jgi:mitochondrial cardiolipin hydrolase
MQSGPPVTDDSGGTREGKLRALVLECLADAHASRRELKRLSEFASGLAIAPSEWEALRSSAVEALAAALTASADVPAAVAATASVLGALDRGYRAAFRSRHEAEHGPPSEVLFSPDGRCRQRLLDLLDHSIRSVEACVFTITDDRLAKALTHAHQRGVEARLITESDKVDDLGSDVRRIEDAGVAVRWECSDNRLMHHKFVVVDGSVVATGSFNWTYSAAKANYENLIVSRDPAVVGSYQREFGRLWQCLSPADGAAPPREDEV